MFINAFFIPPLLICIHSSFFLKIKLREAAEKKHTHTKGEQSRLKLTTKASKLQGKRFWETRNVNVRHKTFIFTLVRGWFGVYLAWAQLWFRATNKGHIQIQKKNATCLRSYELTMSYRIWYSSRTKSKCIIFTNTKGIKDYFNNLQEKSVQFV